MILVPSKKTHTTGISEWSMVFDQQPSGFQAQVPRALLQAGKWNFGVRVFSIHFLELYSQNLGSSKNEDVPTAKKGRITNGGWCAEFFRFL